MKLRHAMLGVLAAAMAFSTVPNLHAQGPWDAPPRDLRGDISQRGFHDGLDGARKDFENHRRPNVNNRDEYRKPNVPPPAWRDYRASFRRGYQVGVRHYYR